MSYLTDLSDLISNNKLDMCNESDRVFVMQQLGINKTKLKHGLKFLNIPVRQDKIRIQTLTDELFQIYKTRGLTSKDTLPLRERMEFAHKYQITDASVCHCLNKVKKQLKSNEFKSEPKNHDGITIVRFG